MKYKDKEDKVEIKEIQPAKLRELIKTQTEKIVGNIDRIMGDKNITQDVLSDGMLTSQSHLNRMMRQKKGFTIKFLVRCSYSLDVKLTELVK